MTDTTDIEIKSQYIKVFKKGDWKTFKSIAEYYFKRSATLKTRDIDSTDNQKLLIRNIQKRLFLGIGGELLIKSFYLKNGYYINKPKDTKTYNLVTYKLNDIKLDDVNEKDTFTFGGLLDNLNKIQDFSSWTKIKRGLTILRILRNKEGHVVTAKHSYDPKTYRDIEEGIKLFYDEAFSETIDFKIMMESTERGVFRIVA